MLKQSISLVPTRPDLHKSKLLFYLFLASLGMFFIASLITYLVVRQHAFNPIPDAVPGSFLTQGPEIYQPLKLPVSFWASSAILVLVSVFMQRACWLVHRERQDDFRLWLIISLVAATAFVLIQMFGLNDLLSQHFSQSDGEGLRHVIHTVVYPRAACSRRDVFFGVYYLSGIQRPVRS